jgi:hypothetical protein
MVEKPLVDKFSRDPVIGLLYYFEIKGKGEVVVSNSWANLQRGELRMRKLMSLV